ncbi:MAG: hypothetical protein HY517_03470 [Candidatus Aenigmarchaeota archaeon]|nr:hypothetical protein [Candidatus Aenigmarchaeota archaeon]
MGKAPLLYLDSAKLNEVRAAHSTGRLAGITINPSLALKAIGENGDYARHVAELAEIVGPDCHKSYQVIGKSRQEMLHAAYKLRDAFEKYGGLGIKVPVFTADTTNKHFAEDGLKTVRQLSADGITVNVTTVQRPEQIVLAAYCGAQLISPFLGRTDDYIHALMGDRLDKEFRKSTHFDPRGERGFGDGYGNASGVHMMARGAYALSIMTRMGIRHNAKILAASTRNLDQCAEAAEFWADIITEPSEIFSFTARDEFRWPVRAEPKDFEKMWPGFLSDITEKKIEGWLQEYKEADESGGIFRLLFHPETLKGFRNFEEDGQKLTSFKRLVS